MSAMRRAVIAAGLVAALAVTSGCAGGNTTGLPGDVAKPATSEPAAKQSKVDSRTVHPVDLVATPKLPVTVRSDDSRDVQVTDVSRILPLNGSIAEIVFSLGLGKNVVGKDVGATFKEADGLPLVTKSAHDVSTEGVFSLRPTVILAQDDTGPPETMEQLKASKIPVVVVNAAWKLEDVKPRIAKVSAALGVPESGRVLAERTDAEISAAQTRVPKTDQKVKVAFLYLRGTAGVYLLGGKGSGADSLIAAAGAVDAGTSLGLGSFTPITTEAMITTAPDVILLMSKGLESVGGVDGLVKINGIAQTPAGKQRRVVAVEDGVLLNFGPRTSQVLDVLVDGIHQVKR